MWTADDLVQPAGDRWGHRLDPALDQRGGAPGTSRFSHGLVLRDVNGDDLPDLVTGKRYFAHNGRDPGSHEPAVLYWFEMTRDDGAPQWIPHRIDDSSGIGVELIVEDVTGDGWPGIITANKKGVFLFEQR